MNVLKEMGIQLWRRRTALPEPVDVESIDRQAKSHSLGSLTNGGQTSGFDQSPSINSSPESLAGRSGSLRDALKKTAPKSDLKKEQTVAPSIAEVKPDTSQPPWDEEPVSAEAAEEVTTPQDLRALMQTAPVDSEKTLSDEKLLADKEPLADKKSLADTSASDKSSPSTEDKAPTATTLVPLDISDLLGSSAEHEEPEPDPITAPLEPLAVEGNDHPSEMVFYDESHDDLGNDSIPSEYFGDTQGVEQQVEPVNDLSSLDMAALQKRIETNEHCPSCGWGNGLLGSGSETADWMFVIDAPNAREIEAKAFFAGRAGQLFEAMLLALGLEREQVYCSSVFKCAPTKDLSITPQCDSIIARQIELVEPKLVITFGEFAAQALLKSNSQLDALRGNNQQCYRTQTAIIPTYSPQEMLDSAKLKAHVWSDLKKALHLLNA